MSVFLNDTEKLYIKNFFRNKILIKLKFDEFNIVMNCLFDLIDYIATRFCFNESTKNIYWNQLLQNNYRDLIAIFNLLLPYIDDKEGTYVLHKEIEQLSDISLKKNPNASQYELNDPSRNNYLISNVQYGLFETLNDNFYEYSKNAIQQNLFLLLESIDRMSNKLFVNWINIRPITITNYKNSLLYQNSMILFEGHDYDNIDKTPYVEEIKQSLINSGVPPSKLMDTKIQQAINNQVDNIINEKKRIIL